MLSSVFVDRPRLAIVIALTTLDSPAVEPTLRSMPAVRIARNMPIDTMALTAACEATFIRLSMVRKRGDSTVMTAQSRIRLSSTPS